MTKKNADDKVQAYRDRVVEMGELAILTIQEKLDSPNHAVALRAALEVLAIAGVSGTKKTESNITVTQKSELDARIEALLDGGGNQSQPDSLGVSTGSTDSEDERDE
jgi:hypothetical protein